MESSLSHTERNPLVFIGTYTEPEESKSEGIYVYQMDSFSGKLTYKTVIKGVSNVSFMTIHPQSGLLIYAVNETEDFEGKLGGGVSVMAFNSSTKSFNVLDQQSSGGKNPCYISIEQTGQFALVANYESGSVAMLPIQTDGHLSLASDMVLHIGSSLHPERQTGPHPHCIIPDRENRFATAVDLGLDKLLIYRMDLKDGKLCKHSEVQVEAGAGPRHLIFNSSGQYAYLINELNSTVILYRYHAESGEFDRLQTLSTLPDDFAGENFCADIHLALDEKHLYASNRGHDSIVCYNVDAATGQLTYQSHIPSGGHQPRIFTFDPSGQFMVVAHQKSNNVLILKIDPITGNLTQTGYEVRVSMPVYVKFANK